MGGSGWSNANRAMSAPGLSSWPVSVDALALLRRICSARPPNGMLPAQPILPTPENLPFQVCNGIHTSKRMCESLVGAISPATRQNGGRLLKAFVDPGGVKDPLVTASAVRIVVLGSR